MNDDDLDDNLFQAAKPKVPPVLGWTDPRTGKPMMHYSTVGENTGEADKDIPEPAEPAARTLGEPKPNPKPAPEPEPKAKPVIVDEDDEGGSVSISF